MIRLRESIHPSTLACMSATTACTSILSASMTSLWTATTIGNWTTAVDVIWRWPWVRDHSGERIETAAVQATWSVLDTTQTCVDLQPGGEWLRISTKRTARPIQRCVIDFLQCALFTAGEVGDLFDTLRFIKSHESCALALDRNGRHRPAPNMPTFVRWHNVEVSALQHTMRQKHYVIVLDW